MTVVRPLLDPAPRFGGLRLARTLVWAFGLVVVVLTWAAVLQQIRFERQQAIEEAVRQNVNRAIVLEQFATRTLEAADITTLHILDHLRNPSTASALTGTPQRPTLIRDEIAGNPTFIGVSITNARGDLIASTVPQRPLNVAGHEAFRVHLDRDIGRLYVSRPRFLNSLRRDTIWLSRRINNPDGSFAGVVAINIAPAQLTAFSEHTRLPHHDVISLIGLDGVVRARRSGGTLTSGDDLSNTWVMRILAEHRPGTVEAPSAFDGRMRLLSYRPVEGYPLVAAYGVAREDVLAPVSQRARLLLLGAMVMTLLTAAFTLLLARVLRLRDAHAREALQANRRLEEAQRIGHIGDWTLDLRTGAIYWSPELMAMYERDPAAGPPSFDQYLESLDDDGKAAIGDAVVRARQTGESQLLEVRAFLPNGGESYRQIRAAPIFDEHGELTGFHGTDQDISERKRLDRLEAEITHLSRVDAMNAMAATLAHELNQPLAAASNYLNGSRRMLENGPESVGTASQGLLAAQQQIQLAGEIIRRVRAMVSNEPRQVATASLSRITDDTLSLLAAGSHYPGVTLGTDLAADARLVEADPIQIQQVLLNLVRNACEAVRDRADGQVSIRSEAGSDGMIVIHVDDNGPGFGAVDARIFSPFESTKESGLGLGLSISRTIVEAHGGKIWIGQRPGGGGGRVSFTVPRARRRSPRNRAAA